MDPFTMIMGGLGLVGGIINLFGGNKVAQQNQAAETQLLHEAYLQEEQQKEDQTLIAQRTGQEAILGADITAEKLTGTNTLLGGLPAAGK